MGLKIWWSKWYENLASIRVLDMAEELFGPRGGGLEGGGGLDLSAARTLKFWPCFIW